MVYDGVLSGIYVDLKPVTLEDAPFTLSIRQDPEITRYIPKLDITVGEQKKWIARQRETAGDYFFVVWDKQGNRLGTCGVYNISGNSGEGGRLALYGDPCQKIESGILMSEFEFEILKLERITGWLYADNSRAVRWNLAFGAVLG